LRALLALLAPASPTGHGVDDGAGQA